MALEDPMRFGPPGGTLFSNGSDERLFAPCEFCNRGGSLPGEYQELTEDEARHWAHEQLHPQWA